MYILLLMWVVYFKVANWIWPQWWRKHMLYTCQLRKYCSISHIRERCIHVIMQLLNPKIRYMSDDKCSLALHDLRDIHALAIHIIKCSRDRQENQFLTYPISEFHAGDKVFIGKHVRNVWDSEYDVAYCVVCVMGWQLKLAEKVTKCVGIICKT